jgi:integrase
MTPMSNPPGNTAPDAATREMARQHRLGWHPNGGWCRKFSGDASRTYFGRIPLAEAVRAMVREEERRKQGQQAEARLTNLSVREALNLFLNHQDARHASGEIGDEQRASYARELVEHFTPAVGRNRKLSDFCKLSAPEELFAPLRAAAISRGLAAAEKHIKRTREFLDWCSRVRRLIPPAFYADKFDPPGEKEKRASKKKVRREKGVAFWTPPEVRQIVDAAKATGPHHHAWVLLMLNGGMGATDLSELTDGDVDWERGCIHTDRSKTLVPRVVPLWLETAEAMKASRAVRPAASRTEWADRFFLTPKGVPLVVRHLHRAGAQVKPRRTDAVRNWFYAVLNPVKDQQRRRLPDLSHLKRHRAGGYTLRSVFTSLCMGHGQDHNLEAVITGNQFDRPILEYYLRGDLREKLIRIVEHVRSQLWPA